VLEPVEAEIPVEGDEGIGAAVALGPSTEEAAPRIGSPPPGDAEPGYPPPFVSLEPLRSDQAARERGVEDAAGAPARASVPAVSPALALESVDTAALIPNGALVGEDDTGAAAQSAVSGAGGTEPDLAVAGSVPAVSPTLAIEALDAEPAAPAGPAKAVEPAEVGAGGAPQTPQIRQDLAVRAAEVEAERLYVAGEAEPGTRVRVFADEQFVGEAEAGTEGNWLLEADKDVPLGEVVIRAEAVEREGNDTVAQAEIPFLRYADGIVLEPVATVAQPEEGATSLETEFPSVSYVIIRRGDNLWRISKRNYGRGLRYQAIFTANQDKIRDPDLIYPGQIFVVPTRDRNWERELSAKPN
jgi:nucleoid-associated protein YgaU